VSLVFDGVQMRYGATEVLRGASLQVAEGERMALIGPNGAGKTTLFDIATGWRHPAAGRVAWRGRRLDGLAPTRVAQAGVGRSHQITRLFPRLTVAEHLAVALQPPGMDLCFWRSAPRVPAGVADWLRTLGLQHRADVPAAALAPGEQRLLEIGLAAANGAGLLLLDEPTAGMGRAETSRCVDLIRRLSEGRTLLMIEHDMAVVFDLSDRIAVLVDGAFVAVDTPGRVRADPAVRRAYLGQALAGDR
jgi:branched-chain amino acid transport system ATP-binding protein